MVMICPLVTSWATPRPATSRMRVAMMGCIPKKDTSRPFHMPKASATASAPPMASGRPKRATSCMPPWMTSSPPMILAATAPAMATTAPTEMSMPWVAMTSVSPPAMIMRGAPRLRMSIRLP